MKMPSSTPSRTLERGLRRSFSSLLKGNCRGRTTTGLTSSDLSSLKMALPARTRRPRGFLEMPAALTMRGLLTLSLSSQLKCVPPGPLPHAVCITPLVVLREPTMLLMAIVTCMSAHHAYTTSAFSSHTAKRSASPRSSGRSTWLPKTLNRGLGSKPPHPSACHALLCCPSVHCPHLHEHKRICRCGF